MKLKISLEPEPKHSELVSCICWANSNELYSVGDDHLILKWDYQTGETNQVVMLPKDTFATDIHWFPSSVGPRKATTQPDVFVLACTDGRFLLISNMGRVEKSVEAHKGAVLGSRWSGDGTALLTCEHYFYPSTDSIITSHVSICCITQCCIAVGEDGSAKIWSRTGMLRTILLQCGKTVGVSKMGVAFTRSLLIKGGPIYCACWSPDSDHVLYSNKETLFIKPLQSGLKPVTWNAHDGIILCVDWSHAHNLIISGGEDRKYKVWDSFGRNLFISYLHDSPISSLSWAPDGEIFVVGAFNTLRLCDKKGWSHSLEKTSTGSIMRMCWTLDGTQFAGACGNGHVIFAHVVDRHFEWRNLEATVNENNSIDVIDVSNDAREHFEFHDRIVKVSLGWENLIVTTATHCYIYNSQHWTTPTTVDLKSGAISIIKQAEKHFLIADEVLGIMIMSYEGRHISTLKSGNACSGSLNPQTVSISPDTVALRDKKDEKTVHVYDTLSGKELEEGRPLSNQYDIVSLALSQCGSSDDRLLAILDKNSDLYLTSIHGYSKWKLIILGPMVTSIRWNDRANMLAAMQDDKFVVWYHPAVIYTDKDLLPLTRIIKEGSEFSKSPHLLQYTGHHCSLRRSDGALISTATSPFPLILHQHAQSNNWDAAVRLCRFVKDPALWACLAGMAASAQDLNTAEVAYSAISEVDKVQYVTYIRGLPTQERINAELALFCQQPQKAESIYLHAGHIFRAIQLNMFIFNWQRALELAVKHQTHVDTVLAYRDRYLKRLGSKETFKDFLDYSGKMEINWASIKEKVAAEEQ